MRHIEHFIGWYQTKVVKLLSWQKRKNIKILHYDLYRLKNYKDISQLGMFETSSDHIKIIEWPDLIKPKPKNRVDIQFQYSKLMDSREVKIVGFGKWKDYKFNEI